MGESSQNDLQFDVIYSPGPLTIRLGCPTYLAVKLRWSFGVLVYVILVGQFPIGQSKQTKSELTRNIIKVDKEPKKTKKKHSEVPTNSNPAEDKKCRRVLFLRQGRTHTYIYIYHGNIWVPGFVDVDCRIVQIEFPPYMLGTECQLRDGWSSFSTRLVTLLSLLQKPQAIFLVYH